MIIPNAQKHRSPFVSLPVVLMFALMILLLVASIVLSVRPLAEAQRVDARGVPTWPAHRRSYLAESQEAERGDALPMQVISSPSQ